MKVVILAGGLGTRLAEETEVRPKPMVEIGGRPILWHIMKHYAHYGFNDFVRRPRLQGRGDQALLPATSATLRGDLDCRARERRRSTTTARSPRTGRVTSIDTGLDTQTGGRLKRLRPTLRRAAPS